MPHISAVNAGALIAIRNIRTLNERKNKATEATPAVPDILTSPEEHDIEHHSGARLLFLGPCRNCRVTWLAN